MATDVREEQRSKDVETLKMEVEKLRNDLASTTRTLRDIGGTLGEQATDRVRETAERARRRVNQTAGDVSHQIEDRPLISIVGAFLVGLVLGALFSRR
ncbi:MAG: hypothetical protein JNM75_00005 [Rhodospirillales bacterium]|nr:hypothetical protein [Rhodospirillales bacterium]